MLPAPQRLSVFTNDLTNANTRSRTVQRNVQSRGRRILAAASSYIGTLSDERTHQAALYLGDEGAYLFFVCPAATNVLEITIWGAEVPTESALDRYTRATVRYRLGDEVITDSTWGIRRQEGRYNIHVLKGNRSNVISQFRNRTSDDFAFRVSVPGLPTGEFFDIGGFEEHVEPVLEACDW